MNENVQKVMDEVVNWINSDQCKEYVNEITGDASHQVMIDCVRGGGSILILSFEPVTTR